MSNLVTATVRTVRGRVQSLTREQLLLGVGVGTVLFYFSLVVLGDLSEVRQSVRDVNDWTFFVAVCIVTLSYLVRLLRWFYYLGRVGESVPIGNSSVVFFSGFMMSVTPGKAGEVWKAGFLSQLEDVPTEKTVAVVGAERITDLFGVSLLATFGILFGLSSLLPLVVCLGIGVFVGAVLLVGETTRLSVLERVTQWRLVQNNLDRITKLYSVFNEVLQPSALAVGTTLGCIAWMLEGVAFWVVLGSVGVGLGVVHAVVVFALGTLAGAVSLLPGGIGAVEASLVGLLVATGSPLAAATTATLVLRVVTLWYGVSLGAVVFGVYRLVR